MCFNARIQGDFLYVRDINGNIIKNRFVYDGDEVRVLDVSYSRQLALVEYPTDKGKKLGYVTNAVNLIKYYNEDTWQNGSTLEEVKDENGEHLGWINPMEKATPLYERGGLIHVVYNTDKGVRTKSGYVKFRGLKVATTSDFCNTISSRDSLVSDDLVNFIKRYEGFSKIPYDDSTGTMTIGYGTIKKDKVSLGSCTEEQATTWLKEEVNKMAAIIKADLDSKGVSLKQNEFDSLCSFSYNCGVYALLKESNLYMRICSGVRDESLRVNFLSFTKAGSVRLQGLVNRRNEECDMFLYGDYIRNL